MRRRISSDEYIQLRKYADEVQIGTTETRWDCPFCGGGGNKDRAFSITRTDEVTVLYDCHRASCGRSGRVSSPGIHIPRLDPKTIIVSDNSPVSVRKFTPKEYRGNLGELGTKWLSSLSNRFGLEPEELLDEGWREDIETGRLVYPIRSSIGLRRGFETRRAPWHDAGIPKTIAYREHDCPWVGWFRGIGTGPVVLVEDMVSALKVSRQYQVACLMGSHIGIEHIWEISSVHKEAGIILALDRDATEKAERFVRDWQFVLSNFRHVLLSNDLKHSSDKEIKEIIS